MSKTNVQKRDFYPVKLGKSRAQVDKEQCIKASYDPKIREEKEKEKYEALHKSSKYNLRVFGYKHPKVIKFMAFTFRCLKDCIDGKCEQLNLDMNNFLLLKNELSLSFLRN